MQDIYRIDHPEQLLSPGVVLFRELLERNIDQMIAMAGGVERLRPHCKTHKLPEVVRLQLDRGITKQKAATLAEAEMLARAGCRDIILAYNLVGPNIARAVRFVEAFPDVRFAALADDERMITQLGEALSAAGRSMGLLLDVNPGRDRTGRPADDTALRIYQHIARTKGVEPAGFHIYDGQLHQPDLEERRKAVAEAWERIVALRNRLQSADLPVPRLVCGGTPTFPVYCGMDDPAIELSPGTCIFHDASYGEKFPDLNVFTPAALVLTRVVSRPTASRVTFDCGTKAVASDPPMGQRVVLPDLPDAVQVLQNEEHLVVETAQADRWKPGDWTLAIPRHVCPTTALHRQVFVIADGTLQAMWNVVARDRQLTI
jgi:D-serine deaminase-like pyridoxal phosphate-dependent protein